MASYAYYCLHRLRMLPSQFMSLDPQERAFVIACIDMRLEAEEKERKRMKSSGKGG